MPEEKKEQILNALKQFKDEKFTITQLSGVIENVSYPTILKWVTVLEAEEKIIVEDYGNIKLVSLNKEWLENGD